MRARVLIVVFVVLALRLPFLNQAIQGDDYNYLAGAMRAQIDPLHPTHGQYVFMGQMVDMRGHPHPPLNMWVLGGLLALVGDIHEVTFHAAYIAFSLLAAIAMLALAERFSPAPLWATLLFLAVPTFIVNGGSLESDVPFLALWMASAALYVRAVDGGSRLGAAAAALVLGLAGLAAYQSVVLAPILGVYLWLNRRGWKPGWIVLAAPFAVLGGWQSLERFTGGALPAGVLASYFESFGFQALGAKLASAVSLTVHAGWLVFPALAWLAFGRLPRWAWVGIGAATLVGAVLADAHPLFWVTFGTGLIVLVWCLCGLMRRQDKDELFLVVWVVVFFAAALVVFFAGSARYLLPIAAPVALLVANRLRHRPAWLAAGLAAQLALGLGLAVMNYQHWGSYRSFAHRMEQEIAGRRTWINGEHGLRFYAESAGALPLEEGQAVRPGEMILTSEIAYPVAFTTGGGALTHLAAAEVRNVVPLRIIGLGARSGYSTTLGYRPFDVVFSPIDTVRAELVVERQPELSWLPMGTPDADRQIVSGIYQLEGESWRWMSGRAVVLLRSPSGPQHAEVDLYIPDVTPARSVRVSVNGAVVAEQTYPAPGGYTLRSQAPVETSGPTATLEITLDQTFSPPGDRRQLGLVLNALGFR